MPLPEFNLVGDLPEGRHLATLAEVVTHFGSGTPQRLAVTDCLRRIYELAVATGCLDHDPQRPLVDISARADFLFP